MRIAIGSLSQEVHGFNPLPTTLEDFETLGILYGGEIIERFSNVSNELGGFIKAADTDGDVELVPTISARAWPGGKCDAETHRFLRNSLLESLRAVRLLDGILLALHGAMSAEDEPDVEGALLAEIRREWGHIPIIISLDHHANVTKSMIDSVDALVGYHTEPHLDIFETGFKAAKLIFSTVRGELKPVIKWRKIPMIAAGNLCTPAGPLGEFFKEAEDFEKMNEVLAVSIFPEFTWSDNPELGWSTVAVTDDLPDLAQKIADQIARGIWEKRRLFIAEKKLSPAQAVERALQVDGGPVVFSDGADAPTAGATGDSTAILKELLGKDLLGKAMLTIVDPEAVGFAIKAGVGERVTMEVGGKLDTVSFQPIEVTGKVRAITDGRFTVRDAVGRGSEMNMKRTVVLEVDDVYLVLSEAKGPSHLPSLYRSVGLEPREAKIVVAKSPYLFRAAYEPIAREIIIVDAPGLCSSDLQTIAGFYKIPPRPLFPLDDEVEFKV